MGHPGGTRSACAARMPQLPRPLQGRGQGGGVTQVTHPSVNCKVKLTSLKPCLTFFFKEILMVTLPPAVNVSNGRQKITLVAGQPRNFYHIRPVRSA